MPNVVYCALTDRRVSSCTSGAPTLRPDDVVALVALTREQLDFGAWPLLGLSSLIATSRDFANERFAASAYAGAKIYDAALAEDFLAAFHALRPWDDWHDPHYLDAWLVSPSRKPRHLLLKSDPRVSDER